MSYGKKLSLKIIIIGLIILTISSLGTYHFSKRMFREKDLRFGKGIVDEVATNFENLLVEKLKQFVLYLQRLF